MKFSKFTFIFEIKNFEKTLYSNLPLPQSPNALHLERCAQTGADLRKRHLLRLHFGANHLQRRDDGDGPRPPHGPGHHGGGHVLVLEGGVVPVDVVGEAGPQLLVGRHVDHGGGHGQNDGRASGREYQNCISKA